MNSKICYHLKLLSICCFFAALLTSCQKEREVITDEALRGDNYVDIEQAKSIAKTIGTRLSYIKSIYKGESRKVEGVNGESSKAVKSIKNILSSSGTENSLYVVNYAGGGFAILSADRRTPPVLAYSEKNKFPMDTILPVGISKWMTIAISGIEKIRASNRIYNGQDTSLNIFSWGGGINDEPPCAPNCCEYEFVQEGPLLETTWNQLDGFNNYCPYLGCSYPLNGRAPAGCVATTMAQIMKYYEFPSSYSWSLMPLTAGSNETIHVNV